MRVHYVCKNEKVPREGTQSNNLLSPYLACVCACVCERAGVNGGADVSSCASSHLPMPRTEPGETFYFLAVSLMFGVEPGTE